MKGVQKMEKIFFPGEKVKWRFTLIELLVVIAIIAILAAILLPALNKARERGHMATCMNIHKQLGVAFQQYADDSDGYLPKKKDNNRPSGKQHWFWILEDNGHFKNPVQDLRCPVGKVAKRNSNMFSVGMNLFYFYTWRKQSRIPKPSVLFISGDWYEESQNEGEIGFNWRDGKANNNDTGRKPLFRHMGTSYENGQDVVGCVDGHVEAVLFNDFPLATSPSALQKRISQ